MAKHLTWDDRNAISNGLNSNKSFKEIGNDIGKDCTTISKEVKKHITILQSGCSGRAYNNCYFRRECTESFLCDNCTYKKCITRCWACNKCNSVCGKYKADHCVSLDKPPYVCNGCKDRHSKCTLEKHLYVPKEAQKSYEATLSDSRTGIGLTEDEVKHLDSLFSPLIMKKQSIHNICVNHPDEVMVSESTMYRLVGYNLLSARNIDLPRKVRYGKRKAKKHFKVDRDCRNGRNYEDFKSYMSANPDLPITQIDSVEGKKGGKVLLTIHFVKAECMIAILRDSNDSQSVINAFDRLYLELRPDIFCRLFPILLGDNGSEFSNPKALEFDTQGNRRTRVFYCDPSSPEQKGSCERNHEFIRMFIPKGQPLDGFSQGDINIMMDNINSYARPSLAGKTPYGMMEFLYGSEVLDTLGMHPVPPDDVTLNDSIWRKE